MAMPTRRSLLRAGGGGLALVAGFAAIGRGQQVTKDIRDLKPGEFTWHPERSPQGPVAVIVSLPDQRVHVYRNGVRIAVSTCSTGKPGHSTPTGVFTILSKDRVHHSSTYNNAPMPNMNRLTWSGIALHAGNLPGFPASHGCVRLPLEFSRRLFEVTHVGTPVIIAGNHLDPTTVVHPGLVLSGSVGAEFDQAVAKLNAKSHPMDWPAAASGAPRTAFVSVIVTGGDRRVAVLENGDVVLQGDVTIVEPSQPLGSHVYVLRGQDGAQLSWDVMIHSADPKVELMQFGALSRVRLSPDTNAAIRERWHPGLMLVLTDLTSHPDTRTGSDFVVLSEDVPG